MHKNSVDRRRSEFIDKCGGLESVSAVFVSHALSRRLSKFAIEIWGVKSLSAFSSPARPGAEHPRNFRPVTVRQRWAPTKSGANWLPSYQNLGFPAGIAPLASFFSMPYSFRLRFSPYRMRGKTRNSIRKEQRGCVNTFSVVPRAFMDERRAKLEGIFNLVLEADESRWRAVLKESRAGDEFLRREVESLLAHHKKAGDLSKNQRSKIRSL